MNTFDLNLLQLNKFINIHSLIFNNHRMGDFQKRAFWEISSPHADKNKDIYNDIDPILHYSKSLLEKLDIQNYSLKRYCIEFHQRNCFGNKKYNWLAWHKDDYGAVPYKVYSIIIYLRKDITVNGGDLQYKLNSKINTHKVQAGNVLLFKGDLEHYPTSTNGFGCRD